MGVAKATSLLSKWRCQLLIRLYKVHLAHMQEPATAIQPKIPTSKVARQVWVNSINLLIQVPSQVKFQILMELLILTSNHLLQEFSSLLQASLSQLKLTRPLSRLPLK